MVVQAIQQRCDDYDIAQKLSPVVHGSVGGDDRAMFLVATHEDVSQLFAGVRWQNLKEQVVDYQEIHAFQVMAVFSDGPVFAREVDLLDELMGLALMEKRQEASVIYSTRWESSGVQVISGAPRG
jgi:hypothetical protein